MPAVASRHCPTLPAVSEPRVRAVLLDVGGIFHLPDHDKVLAAFARGGHTARAGDLDRAHYTGAARFVTDYDGELPWKELWDDYLDAYTSACGVADDVRADVLEHLHAEFAVGALWSRIVPGSVDALRELAATGVRLGVVSNADGFVGQRLREQEVLQVGPGLGVEVECVIDSGEVGVQKPDPRIFRIALDALGIDGHDAWYVGDMPGIDVVGARSAGIHPLAMDPFGLLAGRGFDTVASLADVAAHVRGERDLGAA
jgi:putative hydrolase of the HAD superfamily